VDPPVDAVLFDLLTGLLDSWSLWNRIAGDEGSGRRWRLRYLELCYGAGESLVAEAAVHAGLPGEKAGALTAAWDQLEPWPEVLRVLSELGTFKLGVVTNCSQVLGRQAARRVPAPLSVVVTAEQAGAYKPDPRPYRMALAELGVPPERTLFVAGSPSDVRGASEAGMRVFWHNRLGLSGPRTDSLVGEADHLSGLVAWLGGRRERG
jgi:2-haloalkanoic acid dehalogenase type II